MTLVAILLAVASILLMLAGFLATFMLPDERKVSNAMMLLALFLAVVSIALPSRETLLGPQAVCEAKP